MADARYEPAHRKYWEIETNTLDGCTNTRFLWSRLTGAMLGTDPGVVPNQPRRGSCIHAADSPLNV
jgi:hypothetical protein